MQTAAFVNLYTFIQIFFYKLNSTMLFTIVSSLYLKPKGRGRNFNQNMVNIYCMEAARGEHWPFGGNESPKLY